MMVWAKHTVSVHVLIDTEAGIVKRVVVDDSDVSSPLGFEPSAQGTGVISRADIRKAGEILEATDWPAWEIGFS